MNRERIQEIVASYNPEEIRIGVLGSHSALEMSHGAKQSVFHLFIFLIVIRILHEGHILG